MFIVKISFINLISAGYKIYLSYIIKNRCFSYDKCFGLKIEHPPLGDTQYRDKFLVPELVVC